MSDRQWRMKEKKQGSKLKTICGEQEMMELGNRPVSQFSCRIICFDGANKQTNKS